jgi:signal transduction histidine kinase
VKTLRGGGIRRKLTIIVMTSSCAALLLACVAFVLNDLRSYRQVMLKDLSTRAQIIGNNSTAALSFGDPKPVEEIMDALSADHHLVAACVFDPEKKVFAQYPRAAGRIPFPDQGAAQGAWFTSGHLNVVREITLNDRIIGSVFLRADLKEVRARVWNNAATMALVMLAAITVAFLLSARLQRLVSDPVTQLAGVAARVARDQDFSLRATKASDDELGDLVECFNEMLAQIQGRDAALRQSQDDLERRVEERTGELQAANLLLNNEVENRKRSQQELESMQQRLMETSRQAGMAEVATGVLHNVGNVLNSVNVSATVIQDRMLKSKLSSLINTADLLRANAGGLSAFLAEDPRGKLIPGFIIKLATYLAAEQAETTKEMSMLVKNIEHIKDIVAMQQSYAKMSGVAEILPPAQLVEDALRMNEAALAKHDIGVVCEFADVPPVSIDRHKALQILVNLVRNAKQAMKEMAVEEKRLTIRVGPSSPSKVAIVVQDNGVGIPPENLARIFQHGFTTKRDGHGFGLHSGANAAKEMGGALFAASEGPGRGATFTLELPAAAAGQVNQAA